MGCTVILVKKRQKGKEALSCTQNKWMCQSYVKEVKKSESIPLSEVTK